MKTLYLDFEVLYQNGEFIDHWKDILSGFMKDYYIVIGSNNYTRNTIKELIKNHAGDEHWYNGPYTIGLQSITYAGFGIDKFILKE